jgi:hypothetical protein
VLKRMQYSGFEDIPQGKYFQLTLPSAPTIRINHLAYSARQSFGKRKLLFDQGRPVRSTSREHRVIEVESRMVQHRVVFAGAL